jgi:hypothetical protein
MRVSGELQTQLSPDFGDYGIALERFFVTTIVKPEEDGQYKRFKDLHFRQFADVKEAQLRQQVGVIEQQTEAQRMVIEAQATAQKRVLEGYSYQEERGYDVAERVASNEAVGQMTNLGVGMGMISGIGGTVGATVGGMMQNTLGNAFNPQQQTPVQTPQPQTSSGNVSDFEARLAKLELLKGKIPDESYNTKMQEILAEI